MHFWSVEIKLAFCRAARNEAKEKSFLHMHYMYIVIGNLNTNVASSCNTQCQDQAVLPHNLWWCGHAVALKICPHKRSITYLKGCPRAELIAVRYLSAVFLITLHMHLSLPVYLSSMCCEAVRLMSYFIDDYCEWSQLPYWRSLKIAQ